MAGGKKRMVGDKKRSDAIALELRDKSEARLCALLDDCGITLAQGLIGKAARDAVSCKFMYGVIRLCQAGELRIEEATAGAFAFALKVGYDMGRADICSSVQ